MQDSNQKRKIKKSHIKNLSLNCNIQSPRYKTFSPNVQNFQSISSIHHNSPQQYQQNDFLNAHTNNQYQQFISQQIVVTPKIDNLTSKTKEQLNQNIFSFTPRSIQNHYRTQSQNLNNFQQNHLQIQSATPKNNNITPKTYDQFYNSKIIDRIIPESSSYNNYFQFTPRNYLDKSMTPRSVITPQNKITTPRINQNSISPSQNFTSIKSLKIPDLFIESPNNREITHLQNAQINSIYNSLNSPQNQYSLMDVEAENNQIMQENYLKNLYQLEKDKFLVIKLNLAQSEQQRIIQQKKLAVILPWNSYGKHVENNYIEYYILKDSIEKNPILKKHFTQLFKTKQLEKFIIKEVMKQQMKKEDDHERQIIHQLYDEQIDDDSSSSQQHKLQQSDTDIKKSSSQIQINQQYKDLIIKQQFDSSFFQSNQKDQSTENQKINFDQQMQLANDLIMSYKKTKDQNQNSKQASQIIKEFRQNLKKSQ